MSKQDESVIIELAGFHKKPRRKPEDKWTKPLIKLGFCTVPSMLMWAQKRLNLKPEEFNIVMHLADFWWDANDPPHPAKETLAGRMSMSPRQIQRHLRSLEKKKLITRIERFRGPKAQTTNGYLMLGLVAKLTELEPEFRKMLEQKRLRRKKAETLTA
jgi:hypothetical protein